MINDFFKNTNGAPIAGAAGIAYGQDYIIDAATVAAENAAANNTDNTGIVPDGSWSSVPGIIPDMSAIDVIEQNKNAGIVSTSSVKLVSSKYRFTGDYTAEYNTMDYNTPQGGSPTITRRSKLFKKGDIVTGFPVYGDAQNDKAVGLASINIGVNGNDPSAAGGAVASVPPKYLEAVVDSLAPSPSESGAKNKYIIPMLLISGAFVLWYFFVKKFSKKQ